MKNIYIIEVTKLASLLVLIYLIIRFISVNFLEIFFFCGYFDNFFDTTAIDPCRQRQGIHATVVSTTITVIFAFIYVLNVLKKRKKHEPK